MKGKLWLSIILTLFVRCKCFHSAYNPVEQYGSTVERYHYPGAYTWAPSPYVNGTEYTIPPTEYTPDFRIEEPHFTVYNQKIKIVEGQRPYRLSPHHKQQKKWPKRYNAKLFGCYCCTVYKRHILLATCAVITTRHILTTATSTNVIVKNYKDSPNLNGILGAWYDTNANQYNSSMYMTPARIHYHPMYRYDYEVNASHPIPCMYDLSLWAATYRFQGSFASLNGAVICQRARSSWRTYTDTIPWADDHHIYVGYLFMKAYGRRPLPWYKYGILSRYYVWPCPKSEWHWFHCVAGDWAKFGMDSGAAMHFIDIGITWRNDGYVGILAFSLHLRSKQLVHYFTVLDTYPVLDFLYESMLGRQKYIYLDNRFVDTQWAAPQTYWGQYIYHDYSYGWQYKDYYPPNYRR